MNKVQERANLLKIQDKIGVSPASIRIFKKDQSVDWTLQYHSNYPSHYKPTRVTIKNLSTFWIRPIQILTSQGWILPNLETRFRNIEILDAKKRYLITEIYWTSHIPKGKFNQRIVHGVFKIFKNKLPERFYMAKNKKNHEWYEKLTGEKYKDRPVSEKENIVITTKLKKRIK